VRLGFLTGIVLLAQIVRPGFANPQVSEPQDTTGTVGVSRVSRSIFFSSPLDTIRGRQYSLSRAFSLGQFLESVPGLIITRMGPIGASAAYSRYGMGRGRGVVYLGGVPLNDPQDDRAPLALTPTTSIGQLVVDGSSTEYLPARSNIEGVIQIIEPLQVAPEPLVAIELSKGDHDLKQRRARYSSPNKSVGIDIGYDELRNKGYAFDARELVSGREYGSSTTRVQTADLRGTLSRGDRYRFSFTQFETTSMGDTTSADFVNRRTGYIALAKSSLDRLHFELYGRSYKVTTRDSLTMNHTSSVTVTVPISTGDDRYVFAGAGYENTFSRQEIGGAKAGKDLQEAFATVNGTTRVSEKTTLAASFDFAYQLDLAGGWGARLAISRELSSENRLLIEARRGYRLPNLGELFLPRHVRGTAGTTEVAGNSNLGAESSLEAGTRLHSRIGVLSNEVGWTGVWVRQPILARVVATSPNVLIKPVNSDDAGVHVLQDRFRVSGSYLGVAVEATGGVLLSTGDKTGYFEGVPKLRANASASIGKSLFKNTSDFTLAAQYEHGGSRISGGRELSAFDVFNLKLEVRLIDAHLYLSWLNLFDRQYETVAPYLMTPRTFVYGIAWTLYN